MRAVLCSVAVLAAMAPIPSLGQALVVEDYWRVPGGQLQQFLVPHICVVDDEWQDQEACMAVLSEIYVCENDVPDPAVCSTRSVVEVATCQTERGAVTLYEPTEDTYGGPWLTTLSTVDECRLRGSRDTSGYADVPRLANVESVFEVDINGEGTRTYAISDGALLDFDQRTGELVEYDLGPVLADRGYEDYELQNCGHMSPQSYCTDLDADGIPEVLLAGYCGIAHNEFTVVIEPGGPPLVVSARSVGAPVCVVE